jgi:predicted anti-sigma-YlaC factor YlaD
MRKFAINKLGDALAETGDTYASDDDPQLVREALPFALKLIESLLEQSPDHVGLLTAASGGFTQYAYAFVQQDADELDDTDFREAALLRSRARRLYLRARDHGLRGLEAAHPGFWERLQRDPAAAAAEAVQADVPLLYWSAASWGLAISLSKDVPALLADLPAVEALIRRALDLDDEYGEGSLHEFMISFEGGRPAAIGGSLRRAREHFDRAVALSGGLRASPFVTYAETVSVRKQDRQEFTSLLEKALAVDPDSRPEWRLLNLVMQHRAEWLLKRTDLLFAD